MKKRYYNPKTGEYLYTCQRNEKGEWEKIETDQEKLKRLESQRYNPTKEYLDYLEELEK